MSIPLAYLSIGALILCLSYTVEGFWEKLFFRIDCVIPKRSLEEVVELLETPYQQFLFLLFWPVHVLVAIQLWRFRRSLREISADCDMLEAVFKEAGNAALMYRPEHEPCPFCRADPRACARMGVFRDMTTEPSDQGVVYVFSLEDGGKTVVAETRNYVYFNGQYALRGFPEETIMDKLQKAFICYQMFGQLPKGIAAIPTKENA